MKEFIIFVCADSTEIFFSKLRSAALNYNLPGFFTDSSKLRSAGLNYNLPSFITASYCAGVSNKHCLLTFFIASIVFMGFVFGLLPNIFNSSSQRSN